MGRKSSGWDMALREDMRRWDGPQGHQGGTGATKMGQKEPGRDMGQQDMRNWDGTAGSTGAARK